MKQHGSSFWLELVWRRRAVALWAGAAVFGVILLGTLLYPPLYESTAQILVQSNRVHYVVSPALQSASDPNAPVVNDRAVTEQDLNSEIELLTQPRLVQQALADVAGRQPGRGMLATALLGLLRTPEEIGALLHGAPRLSALQRGALALQKRLGAAVIRRSNMLEVSFQSRDPVWCREFLAALLNRYFELHGQLVHDARSEQFFDTQIRRLRERLDAAQNQLRAVRERTGVLSLPDQSEAIVYQLSGFQAEYRKNQSRLDGVNRQITALEAGLKAAPMRLLKEIKSAPNPAYEGLRPKVLAIEMNRDDILERYRSGSKVAREVTDRSNTANGITSAAITAANGDVDLPAPATALADSAGIRVIAERIAAVARLSGGSRVLIAGCRIGDGASTVAGALALDLCWRLRIETLLVDAGRSGAEASMGGGGRPLRIKPGAVARLWTARCAAGAEAARTGLPAANGQAQTDELVAELQAVAARYRAAVIDLGVVRLDARMLALAPA